MARDERKDGGPGAGVPRPGVSRRDFLRGGAAGALGAGILSGGLVGEACAAEETAAGPAGLVGPGPVPMRFRINGRTFEAELEPRVTLLDALRERFGLTGSKRVCDRGTCGSCTVTLDGRTAYACSVLAIEAQASDIETVEALGTPEDLHPVQAAFVANDAQQCGFCTPGFVVSCAALLAENPSPTPGEVDHGLAGNFCRCGTYAGIRRVMEYSAAEIRSRTEGAEAPSWQGARPRHSGDYVAGSATKPGRMDRRPNATVFPPRSTKGGRHG